MLTYVCWKSYSYFFLGDSSKILDKSFAKRTTINTFIRCWFIKISTNFHWNWFGYLWYVPLDQRVLNQEVRARTSRGAISFAEQLVKCKFCFNNCKNSLSLIHMLYQEMQTFFITWVYQRKKKLEAEGFEKEELVLHR